MTQDEKWMARYIEVKGFIEENHRNPSSCVALVPHISAFCEVLHTAKRKT